MTKFGDFSFLLLCAATASAIFAYDLTQELGIAGSVPYVLLVFLALITERRANAILLAAIATMLTVIGYYLSTPAAPTVVVLTNRALALIAIWSVAAAVWMTMTQRQQLQNLVDRDVLTGLYSRRYLFDAMQRELNIWRRDARPLALLMLDIDHFKSINDRYGHQAGDRVLMGVASVCLANVRTSDLTCRFGGEEFAILLPNTTLGEAAEAAERLRGAIAHTQSDLGHDRVAVTVSIGLAEMHDNVADAAALVAAADRALYRSKRNGRDRVHIAEREDFCGPVPA